MSKTRLQAHSQGLPLLGAPSGPCQVWLHQWDPLSAQVSAVLRGLAGRAQPGALRTFWDFVQVSLTSRLSSSFMSCAPTALWGLLLFEPLLPMLFSLLCPAECGIKVGLLFTHYEYVNIFSPLSLTLCTSVLFFFWKLEWKILNESFSLETTAFIYWFSHKAYSHESWKMPLLYGYICQCLIMYTCTFICLLSKPSSLLSVEMERFGFHSQTAIRAPVQGHVICWEGESGHKTWTERLSFLSGRQKDTRTR